MAISFFPALGETISIPVSPWLVSPNGRADVKFSASLSVDEFRQLQNQDAKIQAWSDLPHPDREDGQWGPMDFEYEEPESRAHGKSTDSFHLTPFYKAEEDEERIVLHLRFSVPFFGPTAKQYSFTYRIYHSTGSRVEWLGSFGRNGSISMASGPKGDSSLMLQDDGWNVTQGDGSCVWNTKNPSLDSTISTVSRKDWVIREVGKDNYLRSSSENTGTEASLIFLIPKARDFAYLCPKTLAFIASADANLVLNASGELHVHGAGKVRLVALNDSETVSKILASSSSCRVSTDVKGSRVIILNTSCRVFPVQIALIPLLPMGPQPGPRLVCLSSAELLNCLGIHPSEASPLSIFTWSPAAHTNLNLCLTDFESQKQDAITISCPTYGGEFTVTRRQQLSKYPASFSKNIHVSILTPHGPPVDIVQASDEILPTPPPSPLLRPIAHMTPHASSLSEVGGHLANDSNGSISDLGIPSRVQTPGLTDTRSESTSLQTIRPASRLARLISPSPSSSSVTSSQSQDIHRPQRRSSALLACLRHFFFATSVFFVLIFRRFIPLPFTGTAKRVHTSRSPPATPERRGTGSEREEAGDISSSRVVDETTPLLSGSTAGSNTSTVVADSAQVVSSPEVVVLATEPVEQPSTPLPPPSASLTIDLLDSEKGNHALVIHGIGNGTDFERVEFVVDGKSIAVNNRKALQNDGWMIEVDWVKRGQMKVTYNESS